MNVLSMFLQWFIFAFGYVIYELIKSQGFIYKIGDTSDYLKEYQRQDDST